MLVKDRINTLKALKVTGGKFFIFLVLSFFIAITCEFLQTPESVLPAQMLIILASGVGIFLAFRINSGYDRWWEARKIWGDLLSVSRSFGMTVTTFVTAKKLFEPTKEELQIQKELIYAHIGFVHSLRLHLRKKNDAAWQKELWNKTINQKLIFTPEEADRLKGKFNIPCQIIQLQNLKLANFYKSTHEEDVRHLQLMRLIYELNEIQGKCARIKDTVFPWGYSFYTSRLVWLMAILLPFGFIHSLEIANIILCSLISTTFVTIEQVGRNLDNPFENSFNDTPMTALCRLIEIDLLDFLNENRPEPLQAENGVLK